MPNQFKAEEMQYLFYDNKVCRPDKKSRLTFSNNAKCLEVVMFTLVLKLNLQNTSAILEDYANRPQVFLNGKYSPFSSFGFNLFLLRLKRISRVAKKKV